MFLDTNVTRDGTGWSQMTEHKGVRTWSGRNWVPEKGSGVVGMALGISKEEGKIRQEESTEAVTTLLGFPGGSLWMREENIMDLKGRVSVQDRGGDKTEKMPRIQCCLLHFALSQLLEAPEHFVLPSISSFFTLTASFGFPCLLSPPVYMSLSRSRLARNLVKKWTRTIWNWILFEP